MGPKVDPGLTTGEDRRGLGEEWRAGILDAALRGGEGDVGGFGDWELEADGPLPMIPHQVLCQELG